MLIPFLDLKRQYKEVEAETKVALARVFASGTYILGQEVAAFEREWARFCGVRGTAATNSGTDALALALMASFAVRPGQRDEVVTSPLTAGYTALAIVNAGGVPVFADIDPRTCTLDPKAIEKAVTPRTRAIVPVHIYGQMADMNAICEIAGRRGLFVIEDAAQAHGASIQGKRAGAHGHAAAFSFYPTKNLGADGDGGAVTSDDGDLIERIKDLRQGGHPAAIRGTMVGRNSRLDEIQAAVLRVKLGRLEAWNLKRQDLARAYRDGLLGESRMLELPCVREPGSHVFHLFVIQHEDREGLRVHLAARGVETMIHYPFLLHQQPLFMREGQGALPVAEQVVTKILSLPLYPQLQPEEVSTVVNAVRDFGK
jgi:dTDP-4-amino-4,6-dideoxygalactose transaminase